MKLFSRIVLLAVLAVALRRQPELLQRFRIKLVDDRLRPRQKRVRLQLLRRLRRHRKLRTS